MRLSKNTYCSAGFSRKAALQVIADTSDETQDYTTFTSESPVSRLWPLDLVPLKRTQRQVQRIPGKQLVYDVTHPYHPSKWGPIYVQWVDKHLPLILVGPPECEPLVVCDNSLKNMREHVSRIYNWQQFGGRVPDQWWVTYTDWALRHLQKHSSRTYEWGNTLTPGKCLVWHPAPVDLIKEHHLLGRQLVTLSIEQLKFLQPKFRHLEPVTLDLVLCQVWHEMGRDYRSIHCSAYNKYLYNIYTKLPKTFNRYKLTYHAEAPCYHT